MSSSINEIAFRLRSFRKSLSLSQAAICRRIDCAPNRWNQYESASRLITLDIANRLCDEYGLTLDWIYRGDPSGLPVRVLDSLDRLAIAAE